MVVANVRHPRPNVWFVPSHDGTYDHVVARATDGTLICNCAAANHGLECWALKEVRTNHMTTEERMLPAIQIVKPATMLPTQADYDAIKQAAAFALAGGVALPRELNTRDKIAAVMLLAFEWGVRPMTALQHMSIINGRVVPDAVIMNSLLRANSDGQLFVVESSDQVCTLRLVWPSRNIDQKWSCTWDEISRAGLNKGERGAVWNLYPKDHLVWHTMKRILRIYAPDIINGIDGVAIGPSDQEPERFEATTYIDNGMYNPGDAPERTYVDGQVIDLHTGEVLNEEPEAVVAGPPSPASPDDEVPQPVDEGKGGVPNLTPAAASPEDTIREVWARFNEADADLKRSVINELVLRHSWAKHAGFINPPSALDAGNGTPAEREALASFLADSPL